MTSVFGLALDFVLLILNALSHIKLRFYELMTRNGSKEQNHRGGSEKGDEKRSIFILLQPLPLRLPPLLGCTIRRCTPIYCAEVITPE